ncbi:hypothetical protein [Neorhizobium alkalisoli]|jgi:hypothetical protein|uniref:Uncharacterized protein n=1 Tax=Neorhizobium alkalisoli TaxID=528178 RepID=A0A561R265_9HYPH|nr:hypothetical protein [Neorhizobium alkalisoli]TWF56701.1 hypothetical protein FHW37_102339 [Neorhizobium alkalisoli]
MTSHLNISDIQNTGLKKVWNVSEFAKRYRLDNEEETRLLKLLGAFASEQELLMNASRAPRFR